MGTKATTTRPLERIALVFAVALVGFLSIGPGPDKFVNGVDNAIQLTAPVLAVVSCVTLARRRTGPLRRSWLLIGAGCATWAVGQLIWLWYEVVRDTAVPHPSVADIGFLCAVPLLLVGMLNYPAQGLLRIGRLRMALDALTVGLGLLFTSHAIFLGTVLDAAGSWTLAHAVAISYPVADVIALAVLGPVMVRRREGRHGPLPMLIGGVVALTVADSFYAYATADGTALGDGPANAGWTIGFGLIALAARRVGAERGVEAPAVLQPIHGEHVLPAIPVLMAATVFAIRALGGWEVGSFLGMTGAVLLLALAVRQLAIQLENAELNRNLQRTVDQLRVREEELQHRAFHDPLTGLANRDLFRNRLDHALERRGSSVGVAFVDLDDFKTVNDSLGHDSGDQLLGLVAERLVRCTRPDDTVARLGGDEFAVLIGNGSAADTVAGRILDAFKDTFPVGARELRVDASVGVATGAGGTHTSRHLLQDADLAMYAAKSAGKSRVATFEPVMRTTAIERLDLLHDLDAAVDKGELFLDYQPVARMATGEIAGYEALLRWQHPERGLLHPVSFLQLAEESGRMERIGWRILEQAFAAQRHFPLTDGAPEPWISVNLSARQLLSPDAPTALAKAIANSGIPADRIVLEVTEGTLLSGAEVAVRLEELKDQGVRLAVDDFGVGYSSLSYLSQLPFDIVKIDRTFVDGMGHDVNQDILVHAIIGLAQDLGIRTIAEGVEHAWQLERLRDLGCDAVQGYLIGAPAAPPVAQG